METKLVSLVQRGLFAGPIDKYVEREGPFDSDLEPCYNELEKFLKENAKTISPQKIVPLPFIEEGVITGPKANSTYFFNSCLVENIWHPGGAFSDSMAHIIEIAGNSPDVDKSISPVREPLVRALSRSVFFTKSAYPIKKTKVYQTEQSIDLISFSSISDLEKFLEEKEREKLIVANNLFEQTKDLEGPLGPRLSGEPKILYEIEDYFRQVEFYPIVRDQIKRILEYVPFVFPENWKSPDNFAEMSELEKKAYTEIARVGLQQIPGPIIQRVIEVTIEHRNNYQRSERNK